RPYNKDFQPSKNILSPTTHPCTEEEEAAVADTHHSTTSVHFRARPPLGGRALSGRRQRFWPRKAHPVKRCSTKAVAAYSTMPRKASTSRPAKTICTWKAAGASSMSLPMPLLAPTVSDTTAPTNAKVMATFREPKK